jgi:hypothetical protein
MYRQNVSIKITIYSKVKQNVNQLDMSFLLKTGFMIDDGDVDGAAAATVEEEEEEERLS